MHPLELFDRFRRWFGWVAPGHQLWERKPEQVAPGRSDDWLLEPPSLEEARCCFLSWMKSGPCFVINNSAWKCGSATAAVFDQPAHGAAGAPSQCASQLMYRAEQLSHN